MAPNPESTKQQLITAAETLLSERGIEGVSLREINAAAGQKNSTALQYHFGDRYGLLRAVLRKHGAGIDAERHAMLDVYESSDVPDLRELTSALVTPLAAKLADRNGGREYLQINAQLVNRPDIRIEERKHPNSISRWRQLVAPFLPEVAVRPLHHRFTAIRVSSTELARRAAGKPRRDDLLFTSHLIDIVAALLAAPVSEETARLLRERG
jgi:AcrR family transcriptional regulator